VRYHNPLGLSLSYPKGLYFQSLGPAQPAVQAPGGPSLATTVTLANFPKSKGRAGRMAGLGLSRSRHLPAQGVVLEIDGAQGVSSLRQPTHGYRSGWLTFALALGRTSGIATGSQIRSNTLWMRAVSPTPSVRGSVPMHRTGSGWSSPRSSPPSDSAQPSHDGRGDCDSLPSRLIEDRQPAGAA
jgi:hypothetical protein